MLNKPCQETALHILSSIVGADEAPLQYSGGTGFAFPHYIQTHTHSRAESHSYVHHLKKLNSFHLPHPINKYHFKSKAEFKYSHESLLAPCISML